MKPPEDLDAFEDEEEFEPDAEASGDNDPDEAQVVAAADLPEALPNPSGESGASR